MFHSQRYRSSFSTLLYTPLSRLQPISSMVSYLPCIPDVLYLLQIVYVICEQLLKLCGCHRSAGLDLRVKNRPFYKSFLTFRTRMSKPPDPTTPDEVMGKITKDLRLSKNESGGNRGDWRKKKEDKHQWAKLFMGWIDIRKKV